MSIDGVTNPMPAYPRLGLLRKGGPKRMVKSKKTGKMIEVAGEDLDHFRFVSDNDAAKQRFREVYGEQPREINVRLPFATKDENFDAWMKEYGKGGLRRKCSRPEGRENGIVLWQDADGSFRTDPQTCQFPNCECKPTGVLHIIIPELVPVVGVGTVWALTTAWNDCTELSRNLAAAEDSARRLGMDLRGIPFVLSRRLDDVSTPPREEGGARIRDEKWMLHIEPRADWVNAQIQAFQQLALPAVAVARLMAPTPTPEDEIFMSNGDWEGPVEHPEVEILDDDLEPEPIEAAPEPRTRARSGNSKPASIPQTGPGLLEYVNGRVQVPYDNLLQLRKALHKEGLEGKAWPAYQKNPDWWGQALELAMEHAEAKVKPEQDELPLEA